MEVSASIFESGPSRLPRIIIPKPFTIVTEFLFSDVQSSVADCDEWISELELVVTGVKEQYEMTGNAFIVHTRKDWCLLADVYTGLDINDPEQVCILKTSGLVECLKYFRELLIMSKIDGLDSAVSKIGKHDIELQTQGNVDPELIRTILTDWSTSARLVN